MLVLVLLAIPPATAPPDRVDALERRLVEVGVVERMAEYAALACDALADATNELNGNGPPVLWPGYSRIGGWPRMRPQTRKRR